MAFMTDDHAVGGQLMCGAGTPVVLGVGEEKVRGAAFVEGPLQVGKASEYSSSQASLLVGQLGNGDVKTSPLYSLWCKLYARFERFVRVDELLKSRFIEADVVRTRVLLASVKNFEIDHPTKSDMKLIHTCLEGPENGVYVRGRLVNKTEIELPDYWVGLVHDDSITVSITPIGAHQDIIVKRVVDNKVYLQARPGVPIHCYYHVFGERKDLPTLVTEVNA
jgi:hypothetical protein